ncbi:hypothetical protein HK405_001476, partial [Cladochytrium tenue]
MHSRMRTRVESFLKVLNRAKPEKPDELKEKKTARDGVTRMATVPDGVDGGAAHAGVVGALCRWRGAGLPPGKARLNAARCRRPVRVPNASLRAVACPSARPASPDTSNQNLSLVAHTFDRPFSVTSTSRQALNSLYDLTDEELLLKDSVSNFANNEIRPRVRAMDEAELLDPVVIQGLFGLG